MRGNEKVEITPAQTKVYVTSAEALLASGLDFVAVDSALEYYSRVLALFLGET